MSPDSTDLRFLAARVTRLETQNRRLRMTVAAALGVLAAALLMGQSRPAVPAPRSTVEAERFLLLGRDGKSAAILGTVKGSHGLFLIDDEGETRAELILRPNGTPELNFYDARGLLERRPPADDAPPPPPPADDTPPAGKASPAKKAGANAKPRPDAKPADPKNEPRVFITPFGKKYHREGCRFLSKNAEPIPLRDAAGRFEPCNICKPPVP